MATHLDAGSYGQFSVVARLRKGSDCPLSTLGIILEIQNHLKSYKCICNVGVSSPNFIIHLPTVELQLQILSRKTFAGPNYVLDILPWCSEYSSFDLPWIVLPADESIDGSSKRNLNAESNSVTQAIEGQSAALCDNSKDQAPSIRKGTTVIINSTCHNDTSQIGIDFSYLMIVEIKQFYNTKFQAFQACEQISKEIYTIGQIFSDAVTRAVDAVQNEAARYNNAPPDDMLHYIATFGGDLNNTLWFISEESFGLTMAMGSNLDTEKQAIDLSRFFDPQHNAEFTVPVAAIHVLKSITESVVFQIYGKTPLIATAKEYDENFCTQIWCASFHHQYKAPGSMTQQQAEANSVYRFLKHMTNILGYTIADQNSDTLRAVVSELTSFSAAISELQIHVNKVTNLVHHVHHVISKQHARIPTAVYQKQIAHVTNKINDLFSLLQHYSDAVHHASLNFEHQKKLFRSIKLQSQYRSTPDGP